VQWLKQENISQQTAFSKIRHSIVTLPPDGEEAQQNNSSGKFTLYQAMKAQKWRRYTSTLPLTSALYESRWPTQSFEPLYQR
jgi:hypothetical protein